MNQLEFDCENAFTGREEIQPHEFVWNKAKESARECCSARGFWKNVKRRIPVLHWLPKYKMADLIPDSLAGATMGIYSIPQGLSYSVLASLPPVYGLYASFYPPLIYFFFGSSRQTSMGIFSLICIMVAKARNDILPDDANGTTPTTYEGLENLTPIQVVTSLGLLVGLIQIIMALVHLDFLTAYLPDSAISGLTFGAAIQAFLAQVPDVLGIKSNPPDHTFLQNYYKIADILKHIGDTNIASLIISIIVLVILLASKILIEKRTIKRGVPFPTEIIVMIVATLLSHFCKFEQKWHIIVVNKIQRGIPAPEFPRFDIMKYLISNAISIAVVAFTLTVSMGKLFAKKYSYRLDTNQELLAMGLCNSISSFFDVLPTSASLSRTLVNEASGAKTQVSGLVSSIIILFAILWLGPLLEDLPMCILSCIVLVALRSLLLKITELPKLWRCSKLDVVIWIGTAIVTILWSIMEGLIAGIIIAVFLVVARTQWPRLRELGAIDESKSNFCDMEKYGNAKQTRVPIVRFDAPLIFSNVELFQKRIRQVVDRMDVEKCDADSIGELPRAKHWDPLILDCSTWIYTDSMGIEAIKDLNEELLNCRIILLFANLRSALRSQYRNTGLFESMCDGQFYPSIADAFKVAERLKAESDAILREEMNLAKFLVENEPKIPDVAPATKVSNEASPSFLSKLQQKFSRVLGVAKRKNTIMPEDISISSLKENISSKVKAAPKDSVDSGVEIENDLSQTLDL